METIKDNTIKSEGQNGAPLKDIEGGGDKTQVGEKDTKRHKKYDFNGADAMIKRKELFLVFYRKTLGSIKDTCEGAGISRESYYDWRNDDKEFVRALEDAEKEKLDDVERQLNKLILENDGPSVRYWLDRIHPRYKPKTETHITGTATVSVIDLAKEFLKQKHATKSNTNEQGGQDGIHRDVVSDKKQEGSVGPVQTKQSTEVLLAKNDETKSSSESKTKGNQQNNRCRPAPRLHHERFK